jgi:hypothetical protein
LLPSNYPFVCTLALTGLPLPPLRAEGGDDVEEGEEEGKEAEEERGGGEAAQKINKKQKVGGKGGAQIKVAGVNDIRDSSMCAPTLQ